MPKFIKRPIVVEAYRLTEPTTVEERGFTLPVPAGDWIIIGVESKRYAIPDYEFRIVYEPVDDEARKELEK